MSIIPHVISAGITPRVPKPKPNGWTAIGRPCCKSCAWFRPCPATHRLLLTRPFQQRFDILDDAMRAVYLATVACSIASTVLLIAPVGMHRLLFRRHRLNALVSAAHRCAYAGLLRLGLALTGVIVVVFDAGHHRRGVRTGGIRRVLAGASAVDAHRRRPATDAVAGP